MLLLDEFEGVFSGRKYQHRSSTIGDHLSLQFFEDIVAIGTSRKQVERVDSAYVVVNIRNRVTGKPMRRGDGTFGERLIAAPIKKVTNLTVSQGATVNVQIGVEVKILATAMAKQIERVVNDLRDQARQFRKTTSNATTVGIVGVNHSPVYTFYEGTRSYDKPGETGSAPGAEAVKVIPKLLSEAAPHFDEFLILNFIASNRPPYEFEWVNGTLAEREYVAILQRTAALYESRF